MRRRPARTRSVPCTDTRAAFVNEDAIDSALCREKSGPGRGEGMPAPLLISSLDRARNFSSRGQFSRHRRGRGRGFARSDGRAVYLGGVSAQPICYPPSPTLPPSLLSRLTFEARMLPRHAERRTKRASQKRVCRSSNTLRDRHNRTDQPITVYLIKVPSYF